MEGEAHGLLLALCSGIALGGFSETICGADDPAWLATHPLGSPAPAQLLYGPSGLVLMMMEFMHI